MNIQTIKLTLEKNYGIRPELPEGCLFYVKTSTGQHILSERLTDRSFMINPDFPHITHYAIVKVEV